MELSTWSGWIAVAFVAATASVPLVHRAIAHKRAVPGSRAIASHVALGLGATAMALLHTFGVLPALGSSAAIRGGMAALGPAAVAFFLLFAHVGVGLRLRDPKLRNRAKVRRTHVGLAIGIGVGVVVHVGVLIGTS
jgi:predicted membrane-bound spermidine synthase